jgi:hypothetical protein
MTDHIAPAGLGAAEPDHDLPSQWSMSTWAVLEEVCRFPTAMQSMLELQATPLKVAPDGDGTEEGDQETPL